MYLGVFIVGSLALTKMPRGLEVRLLATMGGCLGRLRENFLTLIFFF